MSAITNEKVKVFSHANLSHSLEVKIFQEGDMLTMETTAMVLPEKTVLSRQTTSKRLVIVTETGGFVHILDFLDGHYEQHGIDPGVCSEMVEKIEKFVARYAVVHDPRKVRVGSWDFELGNGQKLTVQSVMEEGVRVLCYFHGPSVTNKAGTSIKVYGAQIELFGAQATKEAVLGRLEKALDQSNIPKGHKIRKTVEDALLN